MASIQLSTTGVTHDESPGEQNTGTAVGSEDNNDQDVLFSALTGAFTTRLGALSVGTLLGAAKSAGDLFTVVDGIVSNLQFVTGTNTALPVYGSGTGAASNLTTVDGTAITLFSDLGGRMVVGMAGTQIAFALYLVPNPGFTAAGVEMVQYLAISHPDGTNPDDAVSLLGLGISGSGSREFNFNALPSGQNLFGTVGDAASGLVVIGKTPVLNADGTFTNASNTINTSQGGGPTTIGVDNQMFDAGEGAYFTFVQQPETSYLAGATGGLDQNEADDADNIQYNGGTLEVRNSFCIISQTQGNTAATMKITATNLAGAPEGQAFTSALGTGSPAPITTVRVYNAAGTKIIETSVNTAAVTFAGGSVTVSGLLAKYKVEWDTSADHDQVLIEAVAGKFDIGGFGTSQSTSVFAPITNIRFEDDGPTISASAVGAPTVTVDETDLTKDVGAGFSGQFKTTVGTDGGAAGSPSYSLTTKGGDSGLVDTESGQKVMLSLAGGQVLGLTETTKATVFTVSVDSSATVTLDQQRAVVHPTTDPDESVSLAAADLVSLKAEVKDRDTDTAAATLDIGTLLVFKDDGPSLKATLDGAPTLTVDESNLAGDSTGSFASQFLPTFGADKEGKAATIYALTTTDGSESGLVDTESGQTVILSKVGAVVEGRTKDSKALVFTVSVDADAVVKLDQQRAVVHPTTDPDETVTLAAAELVGLRATVTDGDTDPANTTLAIGQRLVFRDDAPDIGPIANSILDFAVGAKATQALKGVIGNDPNAGTRYTVDSFTSSLVVNGVTVTGVRSTNQQEVTYFADTNKDTIIGNTGDVAYYKLSLDQAAGGAYTFEVLVAPPAANKEFNFNALPSGQNLFGTVGDAASALVVIGRDPVLNTDGSFKNTSNTVNTSQGGGPTTIGVDNQMFDPGEGAYFTFVQQPVTNFLAGAAGGLDQNEADDADNIQYNGGTLEVNNSFVIVSQTQGNSAASMKITATNLAGDPEGQPFVTALGTGSAAPITTVRVYNASGTKIIETSVDTATVKFEGGSVTVSGLLAKYKVEWDTSLPHDQVLIEGVAGKFDIGGFGTSQATPTADQKLDFVARVVDGDTDNDTAGFSVGIDGTGIFDNDAVEGVVIVGQP